MVLQEASNNLHRTFAGYASFIIFFNLRNVAEERFYNVSDLMGWTNAHEEPSPFLPEIAVQCTQPGLPSCFLYT